VSANKYEVLTGLEPYRDAYQVAVAHGEDSEMYGEAQSEIYEELERDVDVDRMDQFHVLQILQDGRPWESYNYLKEEVLEE